MDSVIALLHEILGTDAKLPGLREANDRYATPIAGGPAGENDSGCCDPVHIDSVNEIPCCYDPF